MAVATISLQPASAGSAAVMGRVPGTRGDAPSRYPPPSRIGKGHGSQTVAELLVGGGIHQTVELALVGQRHAEEPAFAFGVAVDQRRVLLELAIALGHDAVDRGIRSEERRVGRECVRTCRSRW